MPEAAARRGPVLELAAGGAVAASAAAYWTFMSPYSQRLGPFPYRGETTERVVALTFDDGPNDPYTSRIADSLSEAGAVATFFAVGACVERHPETARRLLREGHVLGSHGYSHRFERCVGRAVLREEVRRAEEVIARELGVRPLLLRPPWLLRTPALFALAQERSLQLVSGEFAHVLEGFQPSPERLARRAVAKVRPGSILIFHDGFDARGGNRASTARAVELVVAELSARGYRFTTVDRLLSVPPYRDADGGDRTAAATPARRGREPARGTTPAAPAAGRRAASR